MTTALALTILYIILLALQITIAVMVKDLIDESRDAHRRMLDYFDSHLRQLKLEIQGMLRAREDTEQPTS